MSEVFKEIKESLTMRQVAEHLGYSVNRSGFILSPFGKEKTASCKLYPHSFYDFSSGIGGDCIRFVSLVLGIDNWQACQYLVQAFSLPISLSGAADHYGKIERRKRELQRQEERQQEFKAALQEEINNLKEWEQIYQSAVNGKIFYPLSSDHGFVQSELQKVSRKLDVLCAADQDTYRRMKPKVELGLSSDRPQWLLDTLAILAEDGTFQATQGELTEIQAQRDFELLERQPGKDRTCSVTW